MRYLLDSDICSYLIAQRYEGLEGEVKKYKLKDIAVSEITEAELLVGLERTRFPQENAIALRGFLSSFVKLTIETEDIRAFVRLYYILRKRGTPIGCIDTFLAAQCLRVGLTLVTNNTEDFIRVPNLKVENWVKV